MRMAYADPPYLGCSVKHYANHPEAAWYDTIAGHQALIDRLMSDYPDGWALSCTSGNLHDILPLCPKSARIGAWVKPFASFKPNVNPAYTWEPLIWVGGRRIPRSLPTVRDYCAANITLKRGVSGAKPEAFCVWVIALLGLTADDTLDDLFPGSGAMSTAWTNFLAQRRLQ